MSVDSRAVLAGLKDFQRTTADYVFSRLYGDGDATRRFLIADEVGLGKTLVARGVIAKAVEHLRARGTERVDVLYICSNAEIARQNVRRLNVTGRDDVAVSERITMLPITSRRLSANDVNFISFTPGTSLELKHRDGMARERQLLWLMLRTVWGRGVVSGAGSYRVLQGWRIQDDRRWRDEIEAFARQHADAIEPEILEAFAQALATAHMGDGTPLQDRFLELSDEYSYGLAHRNSLLGGRAPIEPRGEHTIPEPGEVRGEAAQRDVRDAVERTLRRVMCRTERLAATADRSGMLSTVPIQLPLREDEVRSYLAVERLSRKLGSQDPLELWRAAPYLLNFMDGYDLDRRMGLEPDTELRRQALRDLQRNHGLVPLDRVRRFRGVPPVNARLSALISDLDAMDAWRLLWMPPSLPYYRPELPFPASPMRHTKRLAFSSWKVVPRSVAPLVSYQAECHAFARRPSLQNDSAQRARLGNRLAFAVAAARGDEATRQTGMPALSLVLPSPELAGLGDPLEVGAVVAGPDGTVPSLAQVLTAVEERVVQALRGLNAPAISDGPEDQRWYWAAPLLLDKVADGGQVLQFVKARWLTAALDDANAPGGGEAFVNHLELAQAVLRGEVLLGRQPEDLPAVLALLAIAGPGNCALRSLRRISNGDRPLSDPALRRAAFVAAWGLRSLFNEPEATEIVRSVVPDLPYWRQVLQYCAAGNLQASLDEFAHVLPEFHGFVPPRSTDPAWDTAKAMRASMGLRTATIAMHAHQPGSSLAETERIRMRCHLALTLNEHDASGTGDDRTRSAEVRAAFNSPYWPFVLMTTSAGQEGLDFHLYSHAVVHWNLPSNPVDLEQREGRVHRYKGHAVRKNLALVHGALGRSSAPHQDPWAVMFTAAAEERPPDASELEPYWVFAPEAGVRIERHIPTMAWSKDVARTKAMTTALAAYRLAFGQPRQEDLVAYLERTMDQADIVRLVDELKLDLAPSTR